LTDTVEIKKLRKGAGVFLAWFADPFIKEIILK
jgi:hypothetical protein